jgi:hypothetical protein
MFWHLPSTPHYCSRAVMTISSSGRYEQTGGSHSEKDQDSKRVVKQLPVEILQQCSSASSCMQMCIIMELHYTRCQHYTPFVLNGQHCAVFLVFHNTLLTLLWSFVTRIPPSALLSCPVQENSCHQLSCRCLFKIFWLVLWMCVCIYCFDCSLVSTFTNETRVSSPVTHTMWLRNSPPSLW